MPDIDIDFADRTHALEYFKHVDAAIDNTKKHNTGIYCHSVPYNPITKISTLSYKEAEDRGYFKIDFLNVSVYNNVRNKEHLTQLLNTEPLWDLLEQQEFTDLLFHVNGHSTLLKQMKPHSIEELAMCLALIRPAKKHLVGMTWDEIGKTIWEKPENGEYYFKKAHAIAYAHVVVVQMNLICEGVSYGYS